MSAKVPERGGIYRTNLDAATGSEQGGTRPCIVIQNDVGNRYSATSIEVPLSSARLKREYPFQVVLAPEETGLSKPSVAKCDQLQVISIEHKILEKFGKLSASAMHKIERAILYELDINPENHL